MPHLEFRLRTGTEDGEEPGSFPVAFRGEGDGRRSAGAVVALHVFHCRANAVGDGADTDMVSEIVIRLFESRCQFGVFNTALLSQYQTEKADQACLVERGIPFDPAVKPSLGGALRQLRAQARPRRLLSVAAQSASPASRSVVSQGPVCEKTKEDHAK